MTTPNPYAQIDKSELLVLRIKYLEQLKAPGITPATTALIQAELSQINQAIKENNVAIARRDKAEADRRKAKGAEQFDTDTARASGGSVPAESVIVGATANKALAPPYPKGIASRGQFILMRAEQLRGQLRRLKSDPLPHTVELLPHLEAFIAEQKRLVDAERAALKTAQAAQATSGAPPSTPAQWKETWKDDGAKG